MHALMDGLEEEWVEAGGNYQLRKQLALSGAFYVIVFTTALQGEEMPMIDLHGLRKHFTAGATHSLEHEVVPLLGRLKRETREGYHLILLMAITHTGLKPRLWVQRVLEMLSVHGVNNGPLF